MCISCHTSGFAGTPTSCSACHSTDYINTDNPGHLMLNLSTDCTLCHTTAPGWSPALFPEHDNYYPVEGNHTTLSCVDCHAGNYNNLNNTCAGCHTDEYNQTSNPDHNSLHFSISCADCHGQTAWKPANFQHDNWPLTGAHSQVSCEDCHHGNYITTPNTCTGCHIQDYSQTTNPNHSGLNIPDDCATCHTTDPGWKPASFPIHDNYYPLTGAHMPIAGECAACHHGDYNNTPNTCAGCHTDDYNTTTDPNHVTQQFPTNCTDCHGQTAWNPSTLDHSFYPVVGAHTSVSCNDCHQGNYTSGATPTNCTGCHTDDYKPDNRSQPRNSAIPDQLCRLSRTNNLGTLHF
jgi:hypothetical protein